MQIAVHLVGRNMVEAERRLTRIIQRGPPGASGFQQRVGTDNVGFDKRRRAIDRTIDVAFRRQVHHDVRAVLGKHAVQRRTIADIHLLESKAFIVRDRR